MGPQPYPGDDAERALGPDEQLGEVGTGGGGGRAARAHDRAVGEHDLEPDDEVLDLAVPGRVLAGPAAGDPSADGGEVEALGEVADAQPVRGLELLLEIGPERPGEDLDDARAVVDGDDPGQPGEVEHDAAEGRHRRPAHAAAPAGRGQRDPGAGTDGDHGGDLVDGAGPGDGGGDARHLAGQRPVQRERPPVPAGLGDRAGVLRGRDERRHLGQPGQDGGRDVDPAGPARAGAGELDRWGRLHHDAGDDVAVATPASASSVATRSR